MKQLTRITIIGLGFGLLAVALSSIPNHQAAAAGSAPVTVVAPLPLPVSGNVTGNVNASVSGNVGINNFPSTLTGTTVPVSGTLSPNRTPVHAGQFFNFPNGGVVSLTVPAGTVLTDAHATLDTPEGMPNGAILTIHDPENTYLQQLVNPTTSHAGFDLESGIVSTAALPLTVEFECTLATLNLCQGAVMWSGYTTP